MLSIARLKLFSKDVVSLPRRIHTNRPTLDAEKGFQKFKLKQARMQVRMMLNCEIKECIIV